ncbi:TIGR02285 family protein [Pseudoalteromonas sp. T1lg65]|uniref:TIGR02285 family protein n=1 Tax=Pseudoalteromonas sp. T1lg65 TaxID=2077101 RepID=UPI003F7AE79C
MRIIFVLFMLAASLSAKSQQITWLVLDFPPYYILSGQFAGQGRDEAVIKLLHEYMPNYKFNYKTFPSSRAVHELVKTDQPYCIISLHKTPERAARILYSEQYSTIGLSTSAAIRKSTMDNSSVQNNTIVLGEFIAKNQLMLGVTAGRSYGNYLDQSIAEIAQQFVQIRPGNDTLEGLTLMLLKGRVDVILGYPSEHHYLKLKMDKDDLLSQVRLANYTQVTRGYVGCSNNAQGQENIEALNKALMSAHENKRFHEIMTRWLPEHLHPLLARLVAHQPSF